MRGNPMSKTTSTTVKKNNQPIKWFDKASGEWKEGTYYRPDGRLYCVIINNTSGKKIRLANRHVKSFVQLSDETLTDYAKKNIDELAKLMVKAATSILNTDLQKNIKIGSADIKDAEFSDDCTITVNNYLEIVPTRIEVVESDKIVETPGWQILFLKYHPGDRETPPDVEAVPFKNARK